MQQFQDFIIDYGYFAVYFFLAIGIFGLPIPDEIVVTFVGYFASIGLLSYFFSMIIVALGVLSGTLFTYTIGRKIGKPLLRRYGKWVSLTPQRLHLVERWFNRYGLWTVTLGYFIPGMRHLVCYFSGMSGMNIRKYLLFASIGTCISSVLFITLGYFIGI
ncbi:DedA family protein [Sporosarcina sp. FSL K6-1522]|uniref:DedA family protein n=1 Tax=Sporosarcina sp. FSL K6-1522 TaxID=2921554 RepID=UPI003159ACCC